MEYCLLCNKIKQKFSFKLYHHIANANTVVCTELTSPLFYGMYLNKRARIIKHFKKIIK